MRRDWSRGSYDGFVDRGRGGEERVEERRDGVADAGCCAGAGGGREEGAVCVAEGEGEGDGERFREGGGYGGAEAS